MAKNDMEQKIKEYAEQIKTLEDFVAAVRKMPGMYIGMIGNRGFLNMIREIFQNSIDELIKKDSPCDYIMLTYDERSHITTVEDNGRGIPFGLMERIYASQHTSSNYEKKPGEYSSGLHGVGAKVTNALAEFFYVESFILGDARRIEFHDGKPWKKGEIKIPNKGNKQGTIVTFKPTYDVMGELTLSVQQVFNLVRMVMFLTPIGSKCLFKGILADGSIFQEEIVNQDGIITDLILKTVAPLVKPICISDDTGFMKADIAFTYDSNDLDVEQITSFSNCCPTTSGTHVIGFIDGLCKFFREHMNKIYLAGNKKQLTVVNNDIKTGLKAIVSVAHLTPIFEGQAKDVLGNEDMIPFVRDTVYNSLDKWSKENASDLQKVCKYLKEVAEIRVNMDKEKDKIVNKFATSSLSKGLPRKYIRPNDMRADDLEFIVVEGDSAGGSARNNRCKRNQGIFPIRGKMPNAFTTERAKFLSNEEVQGIIAILGAGYGRKFDITKCKYKKIIFMADADPDGKHIRTLLLRFFLLYFRPLVEAGRVYASIPPLYGLDLGKKKKEYFTDRIDYVAYIQKQFSKVNEITTVRDGSMTQKEIVKILYNNIDYTYQLEKVANTYAIDPYLLEDIIINRNLPSDKLYKILHKKYRFIEDIENKNNTIIIKGLVNNKYQTLFLNDKITSNIQEVLNILDINDSFQYKVNGELCSIYTLMKKFESSSPASITRYKGLGEMNGKVLADTTILPDNRTLIQYTPESIEEEINSIRYFESNLKELIKGTKATRFDLMG